MFRWIPYTFVRTVLFFMGGILVAMNAPGLIPEAISVIAAGLLIILYFFMVIISRRPVLNPGWAGLPLVFLLGYIHLGWQTESRHPDHLINIRDPVSHYQAVVTRFPEEKARTWKVEARLKHVYSNGWRSARGKVLLYFPKEDFPLSFRYGDVLVIRGRPKIPEAPANPGEFDFREFLALKNIYHQDLLTKTDVIKVDYDPPFGFKDLAFRAREWSESTLHKFVKGPREQGIASALVLGVTDGLDYELLEAYSATGSMHILAVSGLHISVLYFLLLKILSPLNRLRGGGWFVAIIALIALWLYAFVTGLSPSVLRAVGMFSFLALARPWARSTNVYNTLAVSAFCLLLFDPFLIRSVGFQLSYMAVLGIVYLYPKILVLWEPRRWIVTEIWKLSAVSVAAQITTFPLGLFYFHQFPNYFLLSNLVVVPLSFVVLILGLGVLAVSFMTPVALVAGFCLGMIIRFLNAIVFAMEGLPFSVIENVHINAWQCVLLLAFILAIIALCQYRKFRYVVVAFATVVCYVSMQWIHFAREVNIQKLTIYKVPGHSAVELIDRGVAIFLTDSVLARDERKIRYHVSPNRIFTGIREIRTTLPVAPLKGGRLISWKGQVILQLEGPVVELPESLAVDWVVIGNNAFAEVKELRQKVTFKKVVLDSSNSFFFASHFLEAAKLHKLDVHSVLHQGAFISKIENRDT